MKNSIIIDKFLNIVDPEYAYILGLMWADGYVGDLPCKTGMQLKRSDFDNLTPLFNRLGIFNIYYREKRKGCSPSGVIRLSDKGLHSFLIKNNFDNKSGGSPKDLLSKTIPHNLLNYWIRGFLDGDGNIFVHKAGRYYITFAGCYHQDWGFMEEILKNLQIEFCIKRISRLNKKTNKLNSHSVVKIQRKKDFVTFLSFVYSGDTLGLERKKDKFIQGVELIKKHADNLLRRSCRVQMLDPKTENVIEEFASIEAAARFLKKDPSSIRQAVKGVFKKGHGYKWRKIDQKII